MTDTKHTPGPWNAWENKFGWQVSSVGTKDKCNHWILHMKCDSCPAHEEANAQLIAAAPDLYAALVLAVDQIEKMGGDGFSSGATSALAKARGEVK